MHEEAAPEKKLERWGYWLENVFWYHYKWYYMLGVFAAVLLIFSLAAHFTKVDWDWTVQYVHGGQADADGAAALKKLFTAQGTDVSGNGRVQVRVVEHVPTGDPGRKDLLGLLGDWENILYVVDGETLALYQSLGYFGDAVSLGDGRWAAVNDAPFPLFTLEEYSAYGYTQEQIDESNEYMLAEHARLVAEGAAIVQSLKS